MYGQIVLVLGAAAGSVTGTDVDPIFTLTPRGWTVLVTPLPALGLVAAGFGVFVGTRRGGLRLSRLFRELPGESPVFARIERWAPRASIGLWCLVIVLLIVRWLVG